MAQGILIKNIKGLVQMRDATPTFLAGVQMQNLPILVNAYLYIKDGLISDFGSMEMLPSLIPDETIDASDRYVFPSFVDSHTHLVFATTREDEFVLKIKGATYAEIAAKGGGILNSARRLQQTSEDELFERALHRVKEVIQTGTGAIEIKSGYGLTTADEMKMLRVARRIGLHTLLTVKTTFLGAHAVPQGMQKKDYVKLITEEMIPAIAQEKLADYIDAFCEQGFFEPDETEEILECGKRFGLRPRLHANQLHRSGGVQVGVKTNAISVDHLENIGQDEIDCLKGKMTMPTALPGAAFFLNLPFPPARKMIDEGLPLAIASDYNPGSAPSGNMPLMISLACIKMKMTPEEAINAATINTAYAIDLLESHGSISIGKTASIFITKPMASVALLPYSFGSNLIDQVMLRGERVRS
ncbi:MAG: imidazolonepropionase [Bacteroidota bacterium]|jgi:imidazolonepropionase|nr:imidazolonepropionase [Cytophagales bacterium]MCE2957183.1 imidazolonepropionase [Flammeovirgaceae bacterium]MCZ8071548.1 imidazolonepropionase [Cytophagales bacterium]